MKTQWTRSGKNSHSKDCDKLAANETEEYYSYGIRGEGLGNGLPRLVHPQISDSDG